MSNTLDILSDNGGSSQSPLKRVVDCLRQKMAPMAGANVVDGDTVRSVLSMESLSGHVVSELKAARASITTLEASIQAELADHSEACGILSLATESQKIAARSALLYAANPVEFSRSRMRLGVEQLKSLANEYTTVSIVGSPVKNLGLEAYDNKDNAAIAPFSYGYNLQAARQDPVGELFFPTVVQPPNMAGIQISTRIFNLQDDVKRSLGGQVTKFNRVNLLKTVIDHTLLRNDQTELVPVVRTGGGANDTTYAFVAPSDVAPYTRVVDGMSVTTAPLAVNKQIDLMGVSQRDALIAAGLSDQTDSIDTVRLMAVYLKVPAGADPVAEPASVIKLDVSDQSGTDFEYPIQGNTRELKLNFKATGLKISSSTTNVAGGNIAKLDAMGTNTARISLSLFGDVVQDTGTTEITAGSVTVTRVANSSGQSLSLTTGVGQTVAGLFAGATVIGFDLLPYLSNTNKLQRGQLLDTQEVRQLYNIPLLPPISALRPLNETEANDAAMLSGLVNTTRIRCSKAAITELFRLKDAIKNYINSADSYTEAPDIFGIGRHLINAEYAEDIYNVADKIDSLTSTDRLADMREVILNRLLDMANKLYVNSAYKVGSDAYHDGVHVKPTVIVATDQYIASYIFRDGDQRTLGDMYNLRVAVDLDNRLKGKFFMSFGQDTAMSSGVPHPLHFGMMAYRPELTVMQPLTRSGRTSMELTVHPSFRHICNCAILGYGEITGIDQVVGEKVTINTNMQ